MAFECKKNCGFCCALVPIPKELYEKHKARARPHTIMDCGDLHGSDGDFKAKPVPHVVVIASEDGISCAFLGSDKRCLIYEDRPWICSTYGKTDAPNLACPYLKPDGTKRCRQDRRQIIRFCDKAMKRLTAEAEKE